MPVEVTSVFDGPGRLKHVDKIALEGNLPQAVFDTANFGHVEIERGDASHPGFCARSEGFNVSVIIDPVGDQAAITTYGFDEIMLTSTDDVRALRESVDKMLAECNTATRR